MQAKLRITLTDAHYSIAHRLKASINFDGSLILLTYINRHQVPKSLPVIPNKGTQPTTTTGQGNVLNAMKKDELQKTPADTPPGEQLQKPDNTENKETPPGITSGAPGEKKDAHSPFPNIAAIILRNIEGKLSQLSDMLIDPKYPYVCDGMLDGTSNLFTFVDANETTARIRVFSIHEQNIRLEKAREIRWPRPSWCACSAGSSTRSSRRL